MDPNILFSEISYRFARSGGKGGQHVNKVETKAEARWKPSGSEALTPEEQQYIEERLAGNLNKEGELVVTCQEARSQLENKEIAAKKLLEIVQKALLKPKKRKATKVPAAVLEARTAAKRRQSEKKSSRQKVTKDTASDPD